MRGDVARLGAACRSKALRATAASAREPSPQPAAPAGRRNDQRQARELQERAILPALQCEAKQDHPQGRFASHVMAYGHPLRLIFPGLTLAPTGRMARSEGLL